MDALHRVLTASMVQAHIWRSILIAVAASLLPPPRPAPIGIRFVSPNRAPPVQPVAARNACAAFNTRFVSSAGTAGSSHVSENPSAGSTVSVSPNSTGETTDISS